MTYSANKNRKPQERSQAPLWFAIGGLLVSLASFSMRDLQIGEAGLSGPEASLRRSRWSYHFVQPTHGFPSKKK